MENEKKLKIGDRVMVISVKGLPTPESTRIKIGMTGTVKGTGEEIIGVEFDDYIDGHDGNSWLWRGKFGHCLNVWGSCLEKIEETEEK